MPPTFWSALSSDEYGFYANINPNVPHPRWSQSSERFIPNSKRRLTLMFNGYDQVAYLYEDMDLKNFFYALLMRLRAEMDVPFPTYHIDELFYLRVGGAVKFT